MKNKGSTPIVIILSLIGVIVLAIVVYAVYRVATGSFSLGNLNQNPPYESCNRFMYSVASDFNKPALCEKISPTFIGFVANFDSGNKQIAYERSECFWNIALATSNKSLCSEVKPVSTFFADGSGYSDSGCQDEIAAPFKVIRPHDTYPIGWDDGYGGVALKNIMAQLGYTSSDMQMTPDDPNASFGIIHFNHWNEYIDQLARSTWPNEGPAAAFPSYSNQVNDFLNRVEKLDCQASTAY